MKENIEILDNGGIICDNPKCDWADRTISIEDTPNYLNKPCPQCGENLLTQDDLDRFNLVMVMVKMANSLTKEELKLLAKTEDLGGPVRALVTTHDKISIDIQDIPAA
jgi:hypothetical protein